MSFVCVCGQTILYGRSHLNCPAHKPHPVQLMVGAPLGPDMNGLLYTLREMYKAEDEGNEAAWHTSYTTLRAMIEAIPI